MFLDQHWSLAFYDTYKKVIKSYHPQMSSLSATKQTLISRSVNDYGDQD